ncbi:MAG: RecQ family ATP-dependent DNA helicase [Bacteroidetes bacterium]|nr:RecQ family ATP-dependent DNA helicase [Bacteroidota bacterium]
MQKSPLDILKQYFNHDAFRPLQEEIIQAVLEKNDALALLPTGGGKSLCFQVPALAMEGMCLVISPLIALMKDQVEHLRKKGITAFSIYSGMSRNEVIHTLRTASESNCKFLYVSPERLETNLFKEYLPAFYINLIAVDEAHCISQWGYDFRPPYLRIAALREELPGVPILALTASATKEVQLDICEKLKFRQPKIFKQSFERPNLSYSVFEVEIKINKIKEILQNVAGSSIVYCKSRRNTKEISDLLRMYSIQSDYYHAGLSNDERNAKQEAWKKNELRVIVCTNAFGMGIDKPDVRTVIHADLTDCLENYYQEAGRAGRDGKKAYAVLLFDKKEIINLRSLPDQHFPHLQEIRLVYQSIMNYLQVASGTGEGKYYDFDIADFIKKFKLDGPLVVHVLRALEQEGLLSFNEQVFIPSKMQFTTNKEILYDFEKNNPALEPLIKTLLRTYAGIFDQLVPIQEKNIAFLMYQKPTETVENLKRLHAFGIIQYVPQKDNPQIYFMQNRVKAEDLRIDMTGYKKRKEQYRKRIENLIEYVGLDLLCRSQFIANYFSDAEAKPCGVCDNCIKLKNIHLTQEEFEQIQQRILHAIGSGIVEPKALLQELASTNKQKLWKVINHLQAENKFTLGKAGLVELL